MPTYTNHGDFTMNVQVEAMPMIGWIRRRALCEQEPALDPTSMSDRSSVDAKGSPDRSGTGLQRNADRSVTAGIQTPKRHAAEFLLWLQEPDGRTGWIPAIELQQA